MLKTTDYNYYYQRYVQDFYNKKKWVTDVIKGEPRNENPMPMRSFVTDFKSMIEDNPKMPKVTVIKKMIQGELYQIPFGKLKNIDEKYLSRYEKYRAMTGADRKEQEKIWQEQEKIVPTPLENFYEDVKRRYHQLRTGGSGEDPLSVRRAQMKIGQEFYGSP